MREILAFAKEVDPCDPKAVSSFAVRKALSINKKDHVWMTQCEKLRSALGAERA
jgi:hypothetical protein